MDNRFKQETKGTIKVSLFKNFLYKECIVNYSADEIFRMISNGDYSYAISDYRCFGMNYAEETRDAAYANPVRTADNKIPRICFASVFRRRNGKRQLIKRNAIVMIEADNLHGFEHAVETRREAAAQPYTMMAFIGADGRSVKIVCRVQFQENTVLAAGNELEYMELLAEAYRKLHYIYSAQLGMSIPLRLPADDRMCLMSVDADAYFNPDAMPVYVGGGQKTAVFGGKPTRDGNDEESPLPGKARDEAYRYIFYCCWNRVLDSGISFSDPYFTEKSLGLLAKYCHRSGLPQQLCVDRAMTLIDIKADADLIKMIFSQAYKENLTHLNPTKYVEAPALLAMKTDNFFRKHFCMKRNVLTGVVHYKRKGAYDSSYRPVTQEVINTIAVMAQREGIRIWAKDVKERVNSMLVDDFNPVSEWLNSLPEWDGTDHISAFARRVPTDNPLWSEFFGIWLRSMVAQWIGLDNRHGNSIVPLLTGCQGCGKTSFTKIILPEQLQEYYNDRIDFKNDNALMLGMSSFALINIDEFDSYSSRRQPLIKYLISKGDITSLKAYKSTFSTTHRYASFIATTNSHHPLTDTTGSRRFLCTKVTGSIDFTSPVDYPQLYAQIKHEVRSGMARYLNEDAVKRLMKENEKFIIPADIDEIMCRMFSFPNDDTDTNEMSIAEIASIVRGHFPTLPSTKLSAVEIGRCLKRLGFNGKHTRKGTCYKVKPKD